LFFYALLYLNFWAILDMFTRFGTNFRQGFSMLFSEQLVIIRGGGDLATGVAYRLHKAGFPIIVLELERPLVIRRTVALATAVLQGECQVEDLHAQHVHSLDKALELAQTGTIPVLIAPQLDNCQLSIVNYQLFGEVFYETPFHNHL
jgi:hypothetical protein